MNKNQVDVSLKRVNEEEKGNWNPCALKKKAQKILEVAISDQKRI